MSENERHGDGHHRSDRRSGSADGRASSSDEIHDLIHERVEAISRKDSSALARRESEDVRTFNTLAPLELRGSDEVIAHMDAWFDGYSDGPRYEVVDLIVDAADDLACAAFLYRVSGVLRSGDAVDMWVRATLIYRLIDGDWRIVHDHESVPFDPASGKARLDLVP